MSKPITVIIDLNKVVNILYNPDFNEYCVPGPNGNSGADYFTDDFQDALETAGVMYPNAPGFGIENY